MRFLIDWLTKQPFFGTIRAVGYRVVHGMAHTEPERITPKLVADLRRISANDPNHLPAEIELIEACQERGPTERGPTSSRSPASTRRFTRRCRVWPNFCLFLGGIMHRASGSTGFIACLTRFCWQNSPG